MDLAVLADLEREGMEAEGLDLPAQRLDLSVGDALQAILDEALLGARSTSSSSSAGEA